MELKHPNQTESTKVKQNAMRFWVHIRSSCLISAIQASLTFFLVFFKIKIEEAKVSNIIKETLNRDHNVENKYQISDNGKTQRFNQC